MKDVAARQKLSLKYLERILPLLSKNKLIEGAQGKGGGYKLTRDPKEYQVGEILRLTEGNLAPVACMKCGAEPCAQANGCKTIDMWTQFNAMTNQFFDSISIADLIAQKDRSPLF